MTIPPIVAVAAVLTMASLTVAVLTLAGVLIVVAREKK